MCNSFTHCMKYSSQDFKKPLEISEKVQWSLCCIFSNNVCGQNFVMPWSAINTIPPPDHFESILAWNLAWTFSNSVSPGLQVLLSSSGFCCWKKKVTQILVVFPLQACGTASLTLWSSASLCCYHAISSLLQAILQGTETQALMFSERCCWDVMLCRWASVQDQAVLTCFIQKIKALKSLDTPGTIHSMTQLHTPGDIRPQVHCYWPNHGSKCHFAFTVSLVNGNTKRGCWTQLYSPQIPPDWAKGVREVYPSQWSSSPFLASWHVPQLPSPTKTCSPASVAQAPSSLGAPCVFPLPSAVPTSGSTHSYHCKKNHNNLNITNFL